MSPVFHGVARCFTGSGGASRVARYFTGSRGWCGWCDSCGRSADCGVGGVRGRPCAKTLETGAISHYRRDVAHIGGFTHQSAGTRRNAARPQTRALRIGAVPARRARIPGSHIPWRGTAKRHGASLRPPAAIRRRASTPRASVAGLRSRHHHPRCCRRARRQCAERRGLSCAHTPGRSTTSWRAPVRWAAPSIRVRAWIPCGATPRGAPQTPAPRGPVRGPLPSLACPRGHRAAIHHRSDGGVGWSGACVQRRAPRRPRRRSR